MTPAAPIASVRWRPWRIPLREPIATGAGDLTERQGLIARVETADGAAGLGESAPLPGEGLSVAALAIRVAEVGRTLVGLTAAEAWASLPAVRRIAGAQIAVETALADLLAEVLRCATGRLARWSGGTPRPMPRAPSPRTRCWRPLPPTSSPVRRRPPAGAALAP